MGIEASYLRNIYNYLVEWHFGENLTSIVSALGNLSTYLHYLLYAVIFFGMLFFVIRSLNMRGDSF